MSGWYEILEVAVIVVVTVFGAVFVYRVMSD